MFTGFDTAGNEIMSGFQPNTQFASADTERYLFVHLKLLNFVEVAYIENRISDDEYRRKIEGLMSKINNLKAQMPSFNVDSFFMVAASSADLQAERPKLRLHEAQEHFEQRRAEVPVAHEALRQDQELQLAAGGQGTH